MSMSRREEERWLSADELALVEQTHGDALRQLRDGELDALVRLVRERRKRARDIAHRQRREGRGKAEPSGRAAASGNDGTTRKAAVLAAAMKRLNNEKGRREQAAAVPEQVRLAREALRLKRAAQRQRNIPSGGSGGSGMHPIARQKAESLARPMEVGRVSQFVKDAQAKRDGRGQA